MKYIDLIIRFFLGFTNANGVSTFTWMSTKRVKEQVSQWIQLTPKR